MPTNYKVLGQVVPTSGVDTTLYTVGNGVQTVVSTLTVCNTGAVSSLYRIAVRPSGETLDSKHYIAYDAPVEQSDSAMLTIGLSLSESDVITVHSSQSGIAFNAYGTEIS